MIVRSTSLMNPMWHRWWHAVRVGIKERPIRGAVRITLILGEGAGRGAENDHNAKSNLGLVQHRCIFLSRFAPRLGNRWVPRRHPLNLRSGNRLPIAQFACGLFSPAAARSAGRAGSPALSPGARLATLRTWSGVPAGRRSGQGVIEPCIPTRVSKPPVGPRWIHEIKPPVSIGTEQGLAQDQESGSARGDAV
jgi:hypothetical protein